MKMSLSSEDYRNLCFKELFDQAEEELEVSRMAEEIAKEVIDRIKREKEK